MCGIELSLLTCLCFKNKNDKQSKRHQLSCMYDKIRIQKKIDHNDCNWDILLDKEARSYC